ncbi:MAG: hypothetical protein OEY19_10435 [Gammaproteobacteria bacterium]|nr:hypothetical protein [Gammaproteobacteria bacterium]
MRKFIIIILFICLPYTANSACVIQPDGVPQGMIHVSMISIIANNELFNNKVVSVIGVLNEHPHNRLQLYKDKNSIDYIILKESFTLKLDKKQYENHQSELNKLLGEYVKIIGVFHSESNKNAGYISDIILICKAWTRREMDESAKDAAKIYGPERETKNNQ